ncbi:MAG: hypothetical protein H0Z24_04720 [Thermosipho sp. (in: Bacteria)]|nr:hypothetical protein [Thermosipho sp. (in: thermotogales)]
MKAVINAEKLKRVISHIDKVAGTVEPTHRIVGVAYHNGNLVFYGGDGCFAVKAEICEINPTSLKFSIFLDILKSFVLELKGNVFMYSDGNYVTLRVKEENLKLKVGKFRFEKFEDRFDIVAKLSKSSFVNDLDFASSHIEEGCMVDMYFGKKVKLISEYKDIICFSLRDSYDSNMSLNWSIPYYTARHIVKSLKDSFSREILIGKGLEHLILQSDYFYNVCGEEIAENRLFLVEDEIKNSKLISKIGSNHFKHYLRRSMILGRNSQVKLSATKRGIFFYTFSRGMEYKGILETNVEGSFTTTANAYFLRSALNRIGGENLILMLGKSHLIISTPQKKRFILLKII